jgi:redox-sensitive bicupin YhaK (pirin superfamily)
MSWMPVQDPACTGRGDTALIDLVIEPRSRDLGGFTVGRVLPSPRRRLVGPFAFFDHIGPAAFPPGSGIDVRPHPHINLSTITYLFEGAIMHRDSLGYAQVIRPGDVNWMTAGRGIAHSERTPDQERAAGQRLHGIQAWVALPGEHEEVEPSFQHHPASALPGRDLGGVQLRLIAGAGFGLSSPVETLLDMVYAEVRLEAGAQLAIPAEHPERALYLVDGALELAGERQRGPRMLVLEPGAEPLARAEGPCHLMVLGGAPLEGPRHIWWNFVSSRPERIEEAKADWKNGRFPPVQGDEGEVIPLPEG